MHSLYGVSIGGGSTVLRSTCVHIIADYIHTYHICTNMCISCMWAEIR